MFSHHFFYSWIPIFTTHADRKSTATANLNYTVASQYSNERRPSNIWVYSYSRSSQKLLQKMWNYFCKK